GGGAVRDLPEGAFPDPGFLRLVHVAPERDPTTRGRLGASPAGWVFEVVPITPATSTSASSAAATTGTRCRRTNLRTR
ncbi:MAG: hypothetical protein L0271_28105, partial [Gemmatimonadetes bacterium]|nr:hypothetical protein [Gemmatimonadota bacterium]